MADMSDAPICPSCLHPHHPDVRCHICGHKGKGNSFRLPKFQGAYQGLHFETFDASTTSIISMISCVQELSWSEHVSRWKALSTMSKIIRRDVFLTELSIAEAHEFDEHDRSPTTRHVLGLIGDAPVCCCRWRLDVVGGQQVALLDRIAVRADYRMRGIAKAAVSHVLVDAQQVAYASSLPLAGLVAIMPLESVAMKAKLLASGFAQMPGGPIVERGVPHERFAIGLPAAPTSVAVPGGGYPGGASDFSPKPPGGF